ncbi:MAG: hypothetical protein RLZZ387_5129 [Chloroflexota bacterium]|jgi:signal transduction histidine kinase
MASSSPDLNPSAQSWLRGLAWSLPGITLLWTLAGVFLSTSPLLHVLSTAVEMVLHWGCAGVVLIALQRFPRAERLAWSPIAVLLVAQALAQVLSGASSVLDPGGRAVVSFWIAAPAALLCVVAVWRPGQDGASPWVQLMQSIADIAVLLMVAWLALAMSIPLLPVHLSGVVAVLPLLLPDLVIIATVLILTFVFPDVHLGVAAPVWFVALISLTVLIAAMLAPSFPMLTLAPEVHKSWEVWRSALLALCVVRWLGGSGSVSPVVVRGVPWIASSVPALAALATLTLATVLTPISPWPAAGVLLLLMARESLVSARRKKLIRRVQAALVGEQQARQREVALEKDRVLTLARLFHDQAGPLNGLWFVYYQLAQAKLHELSDKMEAHLNVLQSLSDDLRRKLTGQQTEASSSRNGDITRLDVRPIIDEAVEAARARYRGKEVPLDIAAYPDGVLVMGHAIALRRILDNLITNALDVIPPGGRVSVQVWHDWQHRGWLTITVRDSGPGLTAEEQARAFDPQMPLRVPLTGGKGMGLGLTIVRELAESMGACYGVESKPGEGSRFWIRLPRA